MKDLESVTASLTEPVIGSYRGHQVFTADVLTAGPSLLDALSVLESQLTLRWRPCSQHVLAIASALSESYAHRLTHMGAAETAGYYAYLRRRRRRQCSFAHSDHYVRIWIPHCIPSTRIRAQQRHDVV